MTMQKKLLTSETQKVFFKASQIYFINKYNTININSSRNILRRSYKTKLLFHHQKYCEMYFYFYSR